MADARGRRFRAMIMQWGPIPPSGGPHRDRYLDLQGRKSLDESSDSYCEVLTLLGDRASRVPSLPFPLVEEDEYSRREIQRAKRAEWIEFASSLDQLTIVAVESPVRKCVSAAMAALNYLEDHPLREKAHEAVHRAAFVKRGLFGCPILLRDDEFWTDCPINISHLRMGFSVGLVSDFGCSVCGRLVEDCDHQIGELYPKRAERDADGRCTLCGAVDCEHAEGESFLIEAYANARNVKASEASFVPRPRYPQARMVEMAKDLGSIGDDPGVRYAAEHGQLQCDADLGPCKGFNDMRDWTLSTDDGCT